MATTTIPEIIIGGYDLPVYSLDFSAGLAEQPSSIKVSFVCNDRGKLPDLSTKDTVSIQIGSDYKFDYYPIEKTFTRAEKGGQTAVVEFVDQSILMDKLYIGLYGTHGFEDQLPLIVIGTEIDPCKALLEGEASESEISDPCDPCRDSEETIEQRKLDCTEERLYSILDVDYSFKELLDKVEEVTSIVFVDRPTTEDDYRSRYSGTLRSVMKQWCSDYGYTFFWGEDNKVHFLDLRSDIEIADSDIASSYRTSLTEKESLRGTISRGVSSYFKKSGERREYKCDAEWCKKINMRPLLLEHIADSSMGVYESISRLQFLVAMSNFSPVLRTAYIWFLWAEITDASVAEIWIGNKSNPMKALGMNILKVLNPQDANGKEKIITYKILKELYADDLDGYKKFLKDGGYFIVCADEDDKEVSWYEFEAALASDFMGKYFVRKFTEHFSGLSYSYLTPDADSVKYYKKGSAIQFPFVGLLNNNVAKLNDYILNLTDPVTEEAADDFLLLERQGVWWPTKKSEEMDNVVKKLEGYIPTEVSIPSVGGILEGLDVGDKKVRMFACKRTPEGFAVTGPNDAIHPVEGGETNLPVDACGLGETYGLRTADCAKYTIEVGSGTQVEVYTPTQSHQGVHPGYDILWDKNGGRNENIYQRKIQLIKSKLPKPPEETNTMETDILVRDATQDIIQLYNSDPEQLCQPLDETINTHLANFIKGLDFEVDGTQSERSYSIQGLPHKQYKIEDGLSSMQIRLDAQGGLVTNLTFSNKAKQIPTFDLFYQKYQEWFRPEKKKPPTAIGDAEKPEIMTSI